MISFYEKLLGVESRAHVHSDSFIWQSYNILNSEHSLLHCKLVCYDEVKDALMSMVSNKALGVDGFNAYFLKKRVGNY